MHNCIYYSKCANEAYVTKNCYQKKLLEPNRLRKRKSSDQAEQYEKRKYISKITLLYGYSLIIAKNFVTVYTAFDY